MCQGQTLYSCCTYLYIDAPHPRTTTEENEDEGKEEPVGALPRK